jgi:hypothetical protein
VVTPVTNLVTPVTTFPAPATEEQKVAAWPWIAQARLALERAKKK